MPKKQDKLARYLEKILFQTALFFIVMLFVSQALLTNEDFRLLLSKVDELEGEKLEEPYQDVMAWRTSTEMNADEHYIIIEKTNSFDHLPCEYSCLEIYINNNPAKPLNNDPVKLHVKPGDLITVEGDWDEKKPATVTIIETHDNILHPYAGYSVYTFGKGEIIGWVMTGNS